MPNILRHESEARQSWGHVNRYIARAGRQTYMSGDTFGCKYVVVRLKSGQVRLHGVRLINRLYPFEVVGRFQSNDKFLNHLWQIGINTVCLCSEDAYVDSAARERAHGWATAWWSRAPITRVAFAGPGADGRLRYADPRLLRQEAAASWALRAARRPGQGVRSLRRF